MILIFKRSWLWTVMEIFPPILLVLCSWTSCIAYCFGFLLSSHPHGTPTAPSSLLLYSYYFSPSCDLCFPTCTFLEEESSYYGCWQKCSLPRVSIPWAITCKIISQMKARHSELLLPPYSTRSLEWMQKRAEWKKHSFRCRRVSEAQV